MRQGFGGEVAQQDQAEHSHRFSRGRDRNTSPVRDAPRLHPNSGSLVAALGDNVSRRAGGRRIMEESKRTCLSVFIH
jgi:hypothetical protein